MKKIRMWLDTGREIAGFLRPMAIPLHSAYTAFFLILSLFPALTILLNWLSYAQISLPALLDFLDGYLPGPLLSTAEDLIRSSHRHRSGAILSLSVPATLWSASRGMFGILSGLGAVYGRQTEGGYWRRRSISVLYTALFLVVLVLTLVLHIFGTSLLDFLSMTTDPVVLVVMRLVDLRFVLLLLLQTALFTAMYALLSGRRRRARDCFSGAVIASLGWMIFSRIFSVYMTYFTNYSNIFGSIYALVLGMLWLYFCICILFYGSAWNRYWEEKTS